MNKSTSSSSLASGSGSSKYDTPGMLHQILSGEDYALALSPGFFRFYAHIGILQALEERGCLRPSHVTGSSAGAMVGGFLASGMSPTEMIKTVLDIKRADIWDIGGMGGLLKGQLFHDMLVRHLPVPTIQECRYPFGATTFDLMGLRTRCLTTGCLATAMRTSCTFPGLFQPVMIEGSPNIDGGVFDGVGLMALPHVLGLDPSCPTVDLPSTLATATEQNTLTEVISPAKHSTEEVAKVEEVAQSKNGRKTPSKSAKKASDPANDSSIASKITANDTAMAATNKSTEHKHKHKVAHSFSHLAVNIVFGRASIAASVLPPQLKTHKLLTVVVENIPMVYPFTMDTMGDVAYRVARAATLKALHSTHMQELAPHHWCCYIDGASVNHEDFPLPSLPPSVPLNRENLRASLLQRNASDDTSSADSSVHIEHTWTTQAKSRGSSKRKAALTSATTGDSNGHGQEDAPRCTGSNKRMRTRRSAALLADDHSSDTSSAGEESEHSDPGYDENEDMNSRLLRTGFNSIPSFSFLNGTYRLYETAVSSMSDTMHVIEDASTAMSNTLHSVEVAIEDAGSAIITDASNALRSAKSRLDTSSKKLFQAVRSTIKTVVDDLAPAEDSAQVDEQDEDDDYDPVGALSAMTSQCMRKDRGSVVKGAKSAKKAVKSAKKATPDKKSKSTPSLTRKSSRK